jgi:hypothetical protein
MGDERSGFGAKLILLIIVVWFPDTLNCSSHILEDEFLPGHSPGDGLAA